MQENRLTSLKKELTNKHAEQMQHLQEKYEVQIAELRKRVPEGEGSNDRDLIEQEKTELEKKLEVSKF